MEPGSGLESYGIGQSAEWPIIDLDDREPSSCL